MKFQLLARVLVIGSLIILGTKDAFSAELPAVERTQVAVSNGSDGGKVLEARAVIDAPPAIVWTTITRYDDLKNFLPGYQESRVLSAAGNSKTIFIASKVHKLLPAFRYQARVLENKNGLQVTVTRVSGDFKEFKAVYQLRPSLHGQKTLLTYHLDIDLGPVPNLGVDQVLKSNAKGILGAIQQESASLYRRSAIATAQP